MRHEAPPHVPDRTRAAPENPPSPADLQLIDCEDRTTEALDLLAVVDDVLSSSGAINGEVHSGLCTIVGHVITAVRRVREDAAATRRLIGGDALSHHRRAHLKVETARKMIRGEAP